LLGSQRHPFGTEWNANFETMAAGFVASDPRTVFACTVEIPYAVLGEWRFWPPGPVWWEGSGPGGGGAFGLKGLVFRRISGGNLMEGKVTSGFWNQRQATTV